MKVVGLAGYIGAGKNLAASMIPGAFVLEWSDRLYAGLASILCVPVAVLKSRATKENGLTVAGMQIDVRHCLQTLGTDWGRDTVNREIWIRLTMEAIGMMATTASASVFAIPGTRFPNEADAIRERGGEVWWIDRPGVEPTDHSSDHQLGPHDCDRVIPNFGDPDVLRREVELAWSLFSAAVDTSTEEGRIVRC